MRDAYPVNRRQVVLIETLRHMILRFPYSPAMLLLSTALVATSALSQSTLPMPAPAQAQQPQPQAPTQGVVVENILARVNDQIISRSDYERADQQLQSEVRRSNGDMEARRKDLLRDLIDQQLLLSKGKELGITGETELIKQLDEIRKQNHLDSMEDLEKAAQSQGVSFEDFKQSQRNAIITQSVVREEVGRHIQLSQSDTQRYYQAHKAEFDQPESVRLSEILIPTTETDDAAKVAAAETKANEIVAKIKAGAEFGTLAKSSSSGPTAQQGGDLGSFRRGSLAKALEDKTFALDAGQTTDAIRTKQGFVILKVVEHPRGGAAPMQAVAQQVEEAAYMERMQPALRQYMTKMRVDAFIDITPGYVDTGASPHQTKPIYSAYTPPAAKKKKKTTVVRYRQTARGRAVQAAAAAAPSDSATPAAVTGEAAVAPTKKQAAVSKPLAMKVGKREKIRYGQSPRETLPVVAGETEHQDAGAAPAAPVEQAAVEEPTNPLESAAPVPAKKRFSDRAKLPKVKQPKGPKADPFAPAPPSDDETATQNTQAAPLGLDGDTSKKTKKPKRTGDKVRYSETVKPPQPAEAPPNVPAASTPPAATPPPPPEAQPTPAPPQ